MRILYQVHDIVLPGLAGDAVPRNYICVLTSLTMPAAFTSTLVTYTVQCHVRTSSISSSSISTVRLQQQSFRLSVCSFLHAHSRGPRFVKLICCMTYCKAYTYQEQWQYM